MNRARAFAFGGIAAFLVLALTMPEEPKPSRERQIERIMAHAEEWNIPEPDELKEPDDFNEEERKLP